MSLYYRTDYIPLDYIDSFEILLYDNTFIPWSTNYVVVAAYIFFNENKNYISYLNREEVTEFYDNNKFFPIVKVNKSDFPANAKYVIFNILDMDWPFMYINVYNWCSSFIKIYNDIQEIKQSSIS